METKKTNTSTPNPMEGVKSAAEAGQKIMMAQAEAAAQLGGQFEKLARSQLGYAVAATKDTTDFMLKAAEGAFEANAKARQVGLELTQTAFAGFKA